jgi:hypothetical protein
MEPSADLGLSKTVTTMDPKDKITEAPAFELSEQFKKAILERQIKMEERQAELEEEQPGPICEPDEDGTCTVCSA